MRHATIVMPCTFPYSNASTHKERDAITDQCVALFGGHTTTGGNGGWTDQHGTVIEEGVVQLTMVYKDPDTIRDVAVDVKVTMDQESVLILWGDGSAEFV